MTIDRRLLPEGSTAGKRRCRLTQFPGLCRLALPEGCAERIRERGVVNAPGLKTVERVGIHGDMYLDRVEHAHGDPRGQYDEHVKTIYLFGIKIHLWFYLPGAHGPPGGRKIDY